MSEVVSWGRGAATTAGASTTCRRRRRRSGWCPCHRLHRLHLYLDRDGNRHAVGPWGGGGGEAPETVELGPSEHVTEVHGSVGPIGDYAHVVTSLKLVTNLRTVGPFGHGAGTHFAVPVLVGASVVGFFARAGLYLEALGVYVSTHSQEETERAERDFGPISLPI
uniref:Jacalin-type lectin domain-containing protein n=1 Tax=Leersia perrieri TaxID=77586 RepID=A0A0D9VV10_9ORYZ